MIEKSVMGYGESENQYVSFGSRLPCAPLIQGPAKALPTKRRSEPARVKHSTPVMPSCWVQARLWHSTRVSASCVLDQHF
jgi:hypothetical protein